MDSFEAILFLLTGTVAVLMSTVVPALAPLIGRITSSAIGETGPLNAKTAS